jgi:tetratricopeptide (TPR) repeat protein
MITHTAPGTGLQRRRVGLPDAAPLPLWQVPTFFAGLLAFLAVAAVIAMRPVRAVRDWERDLARVRQEHARPHEPAENIVDLAESLVDRIGIVPEKAGEAHFLLGNVYVRLADQSSADHAVELRAKALAQLQRAESLGVLAGDVPRLQYRLGVLYHQGSNWARAIDYLNRSIAQGADDPAAGYAMLVLSYLRLQPPDYDNALTANQKQLEVITSEDATAPARLLRAEILFGKGLRLEAIKVLERIGPTAPPTVRFPARFLQARCCQEEQLWNKAVPLWQEVLTNPLEPAASRARVLFVLGRCYRKLDPPDDAGATATWEQAAQAGGHEAQAASLSLAELRLTGPSPAAALEDFTRALEKVRSPADLRNPLLDINQVRELLERGCRVYCEARDFERAQQLAELYKKLARPGRAQERYAEVTEAWARDLQEQAQKAAAAQTRPLQAQACTRYREAGAAYEQGAAHRPPGEQADLLWRSANCYEYGQEPARALTVLAAFLKLPVSAERQAAGWFAVGEAHRALKHADEARQAYYKSIELPTSPVASRARFQLAVAEREQKNFDQAEAILRQILPATSAPDRDAHEKALYLLGDLLYQRGEFLKASVILKEATRQYANHPDRMTALAHLAECYRKLAQEANQKLKSPEGYGDATAHLTRARQEWLEQALEIYQKLADQLDNTADKNPAQAEITLLREASFAVAECRYDLGELPEALRLYKLLFQRHARQVESLQACVKIYQCYYAMTGADKTGALAELRAAVQTSLADLPTMPAAAFDAQHSGTREGWLRWLTDVQTYLAQASAPAVTRPSGGRN